MELRVLRYFLAVAREASISKAAAAMYVTQPTLSRQMMDLEKRLKVKLFTRSKKNQGVVLTEEGLRLRKRAEEIVALADKTEKEFACPDESLGGDVYIGAGETEVMRRVARTVRGLQRKYPLIHYHLFSGNAEEITERLDHGLLDVGVLIGVAGTERYDYMQFPQSDRWGLLLRKDHQLARKKSITTADLAGVALLVSRQAMEHNELSGWFGNAFKQLNIVGSYNLVFNAALLVEEGVGCALCLDKLVAVRGTEALVFKPLEPSLKTPTYLIWKKHQVFSKAATVLLNALRKAASQ